MRAEFANSSTVSHVFAASIAALTICCLALSTSCAVRQAPDGGPADKTAPALLSSFPAADSVNISNIEYIELKFDEAIKRSTVRGEIWLLPELPEPPEMEWKGDRTIRIRLKSSLLANQTYILTIGTGLQDLRNNNLTAPIVVPFSTGDRIDRGAIYGKVYSEKPEGVYIYAYPWSDSLADTAIVNRKPRYYTQVAADGNFIINYLKTGIYRLFALNDQNGDGRYSFQIDEIGLPSADITLDSFTTKGGPQNFRLFREDSLAPGLLRAKRINRRQLDLFFDELLDTLKQPSISIRDSVSGAALAVLGTVVQSNDAAILRVYTEPQEESVYLGSITGVGDQYGNRIRQPLPLRFSGSSRSDTTTFALQQIKPRPAARRVSLTAKLNLFWTLPVDTASLKPAFRMLLPDSTEAAGSWHWKSLLHSQYLIGDSLLAGGEYQWELDMTAVRGRYGESRDDTLRSGSFTVISEDEFGEIAGIARIPGDSTGALLLEVMPVGKPVLRRVVTTSGEPFTVKQLPEGKYHLGVVRDDNANGAYDAGQLRPFQFAEPFFFYSDTVSVRKRWTTEGITITFD